MKGDTSSAGDGKSRGPTWSEEGSSLDPAVIAGQLAFLIGVRRWEGTTQASAARLAEARACNLSAFISTAGAKRNISPSRIVRILAALGLHPTGVLTPGVHRWDLGGLQMWTKKGEPGSAQLAASMLGAIVRQNRCEGTVQRPCLVTLDQTEGMLLHRASSLTTVVARFPLHLTEYVSAAVRDHGVADADQCESSELKTLWFSGHFWLMERAVDTYIGRQLAAPKNLSTPQLAPV